MISLTIGPVPSSMKTEHMGGLTGLCISLQL